METNDLDISINKHLEKPKVRIYAMSVITRVCICLGNCYFEHEYCNCGIMFKICV